MSFTVSSSYIIADDSLVLDYNIDMLEWNPLKQDINTHTHKKRKK